ncbi:MAG: hypothetical protein [Myoviridae sp. ctThM1]|nr:MAG: hypothetical protein [Myoviridae sp. ctThM1]
MQTKDLIKMLQKQDPEAYIVYGNQDGSHFSISEVKADEGINDLDGWDVLSGWRDVKEMEDYYQSTENDPLAFLSIVILS